MTSSPIHVYPVEFSDSVVFPPSPSSDEHIAASSVEARVRHFERLICVCVFGFLIFFCVLVFVLLPKLVDQLTVCPMDYEISLASLNCTRLHCCDGGQIKDNLNCSVLF